MKKKLDFSDFANAIGFICFVLCVFLLIKIVVDEVVFRFKYAYPIVYKTTNQAIDVSKEPFQDWNPKAYKTIKVKSLETNKEFKLVENAAYSISGLLIAKNTNLWIRGINRDEFDEIALIDYGITWGKYADKKILKQSIKAVSRKTGGSRELSYSPKRGKGVTQEQIWGITGNSSHTHIVPANNNVMAALMKVKKYDAVKLDGFLVDVVHPNGFIDLTSDSRTDNNISSRGAYGYNLENSSGGACEIMYVVSVQIGNKIYK